MAATAAPRSPARASAPTSAPPARATSSRPTSGSSPTGSWTPASTTSTSTPDSRSRSRRKAYSCPFVSSVPRRTTVATGAPILNRSAGLQPLEEPVQAEQQADPEEQQCDKEPGGDARVPRPRPVWPRDVEVDVGAVRPRRPARADGSRDRDPDG